MPASSLLEGRRLAARRVGGDPIHRQAGEYNTNLKPFGNASANPRSIRHQSRSDGDRWLDGNEFWYRIGMVFVATAAQPWPAAAR